MVVAARKRERAAAGFGERTGTGDRPGVGGVADFGDGEVLPGIDRGRSLSLQRADGFAHANGESGARGGEFDDPGVVQRRSAFENQVASIDRGVSGVGVCARENPFAAAGFGECAGTSDRPGLGGVVGLGDGEGLPGMDRGRSPALK